MKEEKAIENSEAELLHNTIFISEDSVVEIPGQEGSYIFVTTDEGDESSTRLIPVELPQHHSVTSANTEDSSLKPVS